MTWYVVRIELARTPAFQSGSPPRAYILHLPLGRDGRIDRRLLMRQPAKALVRRFWPNEADLEGLVIPLNDEGYGFAYLNGSTQNRQVYQMIDDQFVCGNLIRVNEPDGSVQPYRVTEVVPMSRPGSREGRS